MDISFNLVELLVSLPAIISFALVLFLIVIKNKTSLIYSYMFIQIILFIWATGQLLEMNANCVEQRWQFILYEYFGVCFIGFSWIVFCILYTNRAWLSIKVLLFLGFPPLICYILLQFNNLHHLFFKVLTVAYSDYGPFFWIMVGITYVYIFVGDILLFLYAYKKYRSKKTEILLLMLASVIPLVPNLLYLTNTISRTYDFTPSAFSLTLIIFWTAIFKYRLLNIMPIAQNLIFNNMNEAIIVMDMYGRIIKYNLAAVELFEQNHIPLTLYSKEALSELILKWVKQKSIVNDEDSEILTQQIVENKKEHFSKEIKIEFNGMKYFRIKTNPIFQEEKEIVGRIITFSDITKYNEMVNEINDKNEELTAANEELIALNDQLVEYSSTVEELAVTKERNRMARDLHDTLGHSLTMLITLLEASAIILEKDVAETREKLNHSMKIARDGLSEIRRSISGLVPKNLETNRLLDAISSLIAEFRFDSDVKIILTADEVIDDFHTPFSDAIYRICQEAITNSIRHGKATEVNIIIKAFEHALKLYIFDNGCGCDKIIKGYGLKGMEERVELLGGKIAYDSSEDGGFNIQIELYALSHIHT